MKRFFISFKKFLYWFFMVEGFKKYFKFLFSKPFRSFCEILSILVFYYFGSSVSNPGFAAAAIYVFSQVVVYEYISESSAKSVE